MAELLPRLEKDSVLPRVLLGTSAGSINVAYLAANLHRGARPATEGLVDLWRNLDKRELIGWLWTTAVPALAGVVGRIVGLHTGRGSLAGFGRFPAVLDQRIGKWSQVQENLDAGVLKAVGIVATAAASGGTVVFVQAAADVTMPPFDEANGILYEPATLSTAHVVASCSIPVLFPPCQVPPANDWYWDGGTRLNTPIQPALALEVDHVVIVSTGPARHPAPIIGQDVDTKPDFDDAILHLVQAALEDPLIADLHSLVRVNGILSQSEDVLVQKQLCWYRFAGPATHGVLGQAADAVLRERYAQPLQSLSDFGMLDRLLGRQGSQHAELQSYVLFDSDFIARLIDMGREAGQKAAQGDWLLETLPA